MPKTNDNLKLTGVVTIAASDAEGKPKQPSFTMAAYNGGAMNLGGYDTPWVIDLSGLRASRSSGVPIFFNHDPTRVVGFASNVTISESGVSLAGVITDEDDDGQKIVANAKNGFEWQASVGARAVRREYVEAGKTVMVNGKSISGPLLVAREAILHEVSIVAIGADDTTVTNIAAGAAKKGNDMDFNAWLTAKGFEIEKLTDEQNKALRAAYDAEQKTAPVKTDTAELAAQVVTDIRATAAKESARIAAIEAVQGITPAIKAKAIAEGWDVMKAELETLRAARPTAPAGIVVNRPEGTPEVLTAALCVAGNMPNLERSFDAKVLEAAHSRYRGRPSIKNVLLEAAWRNGYTGAHFDTTTGGMQNILRAAFSTHEIADILSNVANKFLLAGFMGVETGWRQIAAVRNTPDFKQVSSYRLTGAAQFEEIGNDGKLKSTELGDEVYTNQARTYGITTSITRQDIINDDLGALTAVPQMIGRGGALKLNSVFWTAFLADHATYFPTNASKGNYISGATTVPSVAGLDQAVTKFLRQTDPNSKPLGVSPSLIVAPPEQAATWAALFSSTAVNTGGSSTTTQVPNANIFAGRYPAVISSYLTSTTEWYLLANPLDLAFIEVAFLNGVQQPTIETAEANFDVLGVQMRGYFDFGVAKQEYRAAVKSKGAA